MWPSILRFIWLSLFLLHTGFSKGYDWDVLLKANTLMDLAGNGTPCMDSLSEHLNYNIHAAWEQFKQQFQRIYSGPDEQRKRLNVFCENFLFITKHNEAFEQGKELYKLGINQFSDKTDEETQHSCVDVELVFDVDDFATSFEIADAQPPTSIDWRQRGAVTPVRHQGECGSCWALVAANVIESHYFLRHKYLYTLSPQQLIDCSRTYGTLGCHGGWPDKAFRYVNESGGMEQEDDYPYVSDTTGKPNPSCNFHKSKIVASVFGHFVIPFYNEQAMTHAVGFHGPVTILINARPRTFKYYRSGIYDDEHCSGQRQSITHAMVAVGYGEEDGVPYWIIKNSWGTEWGESGYMRIRRNANRCGVAAYAIFPKVK